MNSYMTQSHSIYPGEFVPVLDEEEIRTHLKFSGNDYFILPSVKVNDLADTYTVDIVAPGIDREELVVYGDDNALLVGTSEERDFTYGRKGFHCHVSLPSDADTELAIAELKSGVLRFYVPKAKQFSKHPCTRIIVY